MSRYALPVLALATLLVLATPVTPASSAPATHTPAAATGAGPAKLKSVTLHIFNRVFAGFHDKVVAVPSREFRIGDTDFTGRVVRFEPDFTLDLKTHKVTSVSREPNNPAFQIIVSRKGAAHDTSWAFFNMPPHFSSRAELAFVATRIEFTNRPALESTDSLAIKIQEHEGGAH